MKNIRVRKINPNGSVKIEYGGIVREVTTDFISIDTGWSREELDLGYVVFKPDDQWIETFYYNRWFNIFRIGDELGELKGFYLNVTRPPVIGEDFIDWIDLALDIWVDPDGSYIILDEDEFEDLHLDEAEKEMALMAVMDVVEMIRDQEGPLREIR